MGGWEISPTVMLMCLFSLLYAFFLSPLHLEVNLHL